MDADFSPSTGEATHGGGVSLCTNCDNADVSKFDSRIIFGCDSDEEVTYMSCEQCDTMISDRDWTKRLDDLQLVLSRRYGANGIPFDTRETHEGIDERISRGYPAFGATTSSDFDPEISQANIQELCNVILKLPCDCGNRDPNKFSAIQNTKGQDIPGLRHCEMCGTCSGVDDSMTLNDLKDLLSKAEYRTTPCAKCSNCDVNQFMFEENQDEVKLRCMECDTYVTVEDEHASEGHAKSSSKSKSPSVSNMSVQCECGNHDPELFIISVDDNGDPCEVECTNCHRQFTCNYHFDIACYCGNVNQERYHYTFKDCDELVKVTCQQCERSYQPKEWLRLSALSNRSKSLILPKTEIRSIYDLDEGDHITWHRDIGYWHHAIIVEVGYLSRQLKVIEYDGPIKRSGVLFFVPNGKIVEHWITTDPEKEKLYRVDYNPVACLRTEEVLRRARMRLGENSYCILSNNCEHFAHSCKTGYAKSVQVKTFIENVWKMGTSVTSMATWGLIRNGIKLVGKSFALLNKVPVSGTTVVCIEAHALMQNIYRHAEERRKGNISQDVFTDAVIKDITASVFSITGASLGSFLGSLLLPFPPLGSLVGATLGLCLGHLLGPLIGRQIMHLKPACNTVNHY